jgi:SAM-dependent methyltransferase
VDAPSFSEIFNSEYNYLTGSTPEAQDYFDLMAYKLIRTFRLQPGDLVLDIGSNDGTFLQYFRQHGLDVLGIEPSKQPALEAQQRGVPTIIGKFEDVWHEISRPVSLITAFNVLAHTDTIHEFLDTVSSLNAPFVCQNHYLPRMVEWCEYDTVYHEHARYYTLSSLRNLLGKHGLEIADVDETEYYGGSIVAYTQPASQSRRSSSYFWKDYTEKPYRSIEAYRRFAKKVSEHREKLISLLESIKANGMKIAGAGAPMKASTLLNYCRIDGRFLDYVIERNPLKIGTYIPGVHLPVVRYQKIVEEPPDYILILAWNAARSIMRLLREAGYAGRFMVPVPEPSVLD